MAAGEESVTFRMVSRDEEGRKKVEKAEVGTHNPDTLRYIGKKMVDKGVQRLERHPADGLSLGHGPSKSGHGGKYTWEGPRDYAENELDAAPPAIDERDPNYVDDEEGELELAKAAEDKKVSGVEVQLILQP